MATSSIHVQRAVSGSVGHNSREHFSYSVVFVNEKNECSTNIDEAYKTYRSELKIRTEAYTERTGQKLQKSAVTQLSAVVNLEAHHTLEDLEPIKKELERLFDTKVYQMAIHRDEGKLVSKEDGTELYSGKDFFLNPEKNELFFDKKFSKPVPMENYEVVKNYHAHIEMMGLDSKGNAIRQKMNRVALQGLQTTVAKDLGMERGKSREGYTKKEMEQIVAVVGKKSDYENTTLYAQKFNEVAKDLGLFKDTADKRKDTHKFKDDGTEREKGKRNALATQKELKAEINTLKLQLQQVGAGRAEYAALEQLNKELKEQIKAKDLTVDQLTKSLETVRSLNRYAESEKAELRAQIITKDQTIDQLKEAKVEIPHEPINASLIVQLQNENEILQITNKALETEVSELKEKRAVGDISKEIEEAHSKIGEMARIATSNAEAIEELEKELPNRDPKKVAIAVYNSHIVADTGIMGKFGGEKKDTDLLIANMAKEIEKRDKLLKRAVDMLKNSEITRKRVTDSIKNVVESSKKHLEAIFSKITGKSLPEVKKEREELVNAKPRGLREAVDELNKQKEPEKGMER